MKALFSISSIFSLIFRHLGRENNPTSLEISTYMRNIGGLGREMRPDGSWNLYPFRQFFAIWVEKCGRRKLESLPFSAFFRYLGRENKLESLPFSAVFRYLGRENNPTSQEISTYMRNIGVLGRKTRPAEVRISTF